ncbi:hypothetical protein L7F22_027906 [Adiantum nelumboides]|nr:hypothetical protein [Adiantum nelumboides]
MSTQNVEKMQCTTQDIWGLLTSLQQMVMQQHETILKQATDIKDLTLKNQSMEHKIQLQDMAIKQQEDKLQTMQDKLESLTNTTQDRLITQDEKLTHICEQATSDVGTWANIVKNANGNAMEHIAQEHHVKADVDVNERNEREKRAMNIMIRGLSEKDNETVFTLNASISDFFTKHFGMQDVVVYGAHRVGKKREGDRAVGKGLTEVLLQADILFQLETWEHDAHRIPCIEGYVTHSLWMPNMKMRGQGGIALMYKEELRDIIDVCKVDTHKSHGLDKTEPFHDICMDIDMYAKCGNVMVMGDMNARIAHTQTEIWDHGLQPFDKDGHIALDPAWERRSSDETINAQGLSMLSMMHSTNMLVLNGTHRFEGTGDFTCYTSSKGASTIDYALVMHDSVDMIDKFEIGSISPNSDHIPIHEMSKWAENNNKQAIGQAGFRPKHSTIDHLVTLRVITENCRLKGQTMYCCFVDFQKAFDTIPRANLWARMESLGVPTYLRRAVAHMYREVRCKIKTQEGYSREFMSNMGVKQGCPLSPTLFGLCIDQLEEIITQCMEEEADMPKIGTIILLLLISALQRVFKYLLKIQSMPTHRLPYIAWKEGCLPQKTYKSKIISSSWVQDIKRWFAKWKVDKYVTVQIPKGGEADVMLNFDIDILDALNEKWKSAMHKSKFVYYGKYINPLYWEKYMVSLPLAQTHIRTPMLWRARRAITQMRTRSHMLRIETGGWQHIDEKKRICHNCDMGKTENEEHVALECHAYAHIRGDFGPLIQGCTTLEDLFSRTQPSPTTLGIYFARVLEFHTQLLQGTHDTPSLA